MVDGDFICQAAARGLPGPSALQSARQPTMSLGLRPNASAPYVLDLPGSSPPSWVDEWVGAAQVSSMKADAIRFQVSMGARFSRFSVSIEDVRTMDTATLQRSVTDAYLMVFEQLAARDLHLVRTWAAIPGIHESHGEVDRYMVFNGGRFAAYSAWLGGREEFSRAVTTASAVGSSEKALYIHCLAARESGIPIDNPRQVPPYRYSRQFGPLPAVLCPGHPAALALRREPDAARRRDGQHRRRAVDAPRRPGGPDRRDLPEPGGGGGVRLRRARGERRTARRNRTSCQAIARFGSTIER